MQPSTIITLLAAASLTAAMPPKSHKGSGGAANACGQDQKLSCCNSVGLSVLGSECSLLSVLGGNCNGNVQCCNVTQNGQINLINACVPVVL